MTDIETLVRDTREKVISSHYQEAFTELMLLVAKFPLQTTFQVIVPSETAPELAHRFTNDNGYKAVVCTSFLSRTCYLEITAPLPQNLIHSKPAETKVVEEENTVKDTQSKDEVK